MGELADVLARAFGPPVREREHPLHLVYDRAAEALYFEEEDDPRLAALFADMAREEAAKALAELTDAPGA